GILSSLHFSFVNQVRNLGHYDALATVDFLDMGFGTHDHTASTGFVSTAHAFQTIDKTTGWEVRSFDVLHQFLHSDISVVDVGNDTLAHLIEVVWRHIGSHTNRNTTYTVEEQVRHLGRQQFRLLQGVIEVGLEVNSFFVQVLQKF